MKNVLALFVLSGIVATQDASKPGEFDVSVLTPEGQEAYRTLLSIEEAHGTSFGFAGFSDPDAPLYHLWDDPHGEPALRALVAEASPAGRFLALCGLLPLEADVYAACREELAGAEEVVTVFPGGCSGYRVPLHEAAERYVDEVSGDLRRHWAYSRPYRHFEPEAGYEEELSPRGREAMEILRGAAYVDGAYWVEVRDAFGPMRALYDLLEEPRAADACIDLIQSAGPAGRIYGAGGLVQACGQAVGHARRHLESDEELVWIELEGQRHSSTVAAAAKLLLTGGHAWTRGMSERRSYHEFWSKNRRMEARPAPFDRSRLTPEQQRAYDDLVRAETVQLGRWDTLAPSTRALFTLLDADDPADAFELLSATASPAGRLLAVCGLHSLDRERARRAELVLKKSGMIVPTLSREGALDQRIDIVLDALVSDGALPRRLLSEWKAARHGGPQADERRELSVEGFRCLQTLSPRGFVEHPLRLENSGFGVSLARSGDQLLVGGTPYIDPEFRGAVFALRPSGDRWSLDQTLLPTSRTGGFGEKVAASESVLAILRSGSAATNDPYDGAVELFEPGADGWVRSAEFSIGTAYVQGLDVAGDTVAAVGQGLAFVLERGPVGWQRRELALPERTPCHAVAVETIRRDRIAVGHGGAVSVFRRSADGWTKALELQEGEDGPLGRVVSLAFEGGRLLVGEHTVTAGARVTGALVVFEERDQAWIPTHTLRPRDACPGDGFGIALALDGDRLAVMAERGPVRLFELEDERWRAVAKAGPWNRGPLDPYPYDTFRAGVCNLSGDSLLIGIPYSRNREEPSRLAAFDVSRAFGMTDR